MDLSRKRNGLPHVRNATHPSYRTLHAQPEARVHEGAVLAEVQIPAVRLGVESLLHDARGEEAEALSTLNQSILLAQPGGVLRPFIDMGPRMASLLSRLLRQGTGSVYLKGILQAFPTQKPAPAPNGAKNLIEPLTDRELEILALLAQRLSNKEIARELVISPMTVKRHTINIYQKLNTNSRREAVDVASALGLFSLQNMPQTLPV